MIQIRIKSLKNKNSLQKIIHALLSKGNNNDNYNDNNNNNNNNNKFPH